MSGIGEGCQNLGCKRSWKKAVLGRLSKDSRCRAPGARESQYFVVGGEESLVRGTSCSLNAELSPTESQRASSSAPPKLSTLSNQLKRHFLQTHYVLRTVLAPWLFFVCFF